MAELPDYLVEMGLIEEDKNKVRLVTLNRPKKLNCITLPMVKRLCELYEKWECDAEVKLIIMKGAGRAFCAGGDLRMFFKHGKKDDGLCWEVVYRKYWLDVHLHSYRKPMIALWNGLVMGGGAGLTVPCQFRIATEKTVFSMPEAAIGYHTDVGASYFLSHLPGYIGEYLALTGARIDGVDMVFCGLATHFVQSEKLQELEEGLVNMDTSDRSAIAAVIEKFASPVQLAEKSAFQSLELVNEIFSKDSVEEILEALIKQSSNCTLEWIKESIKVLKRSSPTGIKMSFRSLREGRHQSIAECMRREFRLTIHTLSSLCSNDLYEGIRAIVIDKDNSPEWDPGMYTDVIPEKLDPLFQAFEDEAKELQVPDNTSSESSRWCGKYESTVWSRQKEQ